MRRRIPVDVYVDQAITSSSHHASRPKELAAIAGKWACTVQYIGSCIDVFDAVPPSPSLDTVTGLMATITAG